MKLPGNPFYPPGCSEADINRRFGDPAETVCEECGELVTVDEVDRDGVCVDCRLKEQGQEEEE